MHAASIAAALQTRDAEVSASPALRRLTRRQLDVLACLCQGLPPRKIAAHYGIDVKTVGTHRARIMEKLGLTTNVQLGIWAERYGFARTFHVPE